MSRRLVLLRHGRTAWNLVGRVQGQTDIGLDEVGRAQAAAVAPVMAALRPEVIWSSDLARARETAAPVAQACGLAVAAYDERLREFALGDWQGATRAELQARDPGTAAAFDRFRRGHYDDVPGGERAAQVAARAAGALTELATALRQDGTGLAVSHGGTLRIAVGALLGWTDGQFRSLRGLGNCCWAELVETDPADRDDPGGPGWRLDAYHRQPPDVGTLGDRG